MRMKEDDFDKDLSGEVDKNRLKNLYAELEDLLCDAPPEWKCSDDLNELYAEMKNLYEALDHIVGDVETPEENKVALGDCLMKPYMFFFVPCIIGIILDFCVLKTISQCWFMFAAVLLMVTLYAGTVNLYVKMSREL